MFCPPPLLGGLVVLDNHWLLILLLNPLELLELVPLDQHRLPLVLDHLAFAIERLPIALGPVTQVVMRTEEQLGEALEQVLKICVEHGQRMHRYELFGEPRIWTDVRTSLNIIISISLPSCGNVEILVLEIIVLLYDGIEGRIAFGILELGWSLSRGWYGLV